MIFNGRSGGRGLRGLGNRNLRGLRIHGYGAHLSGFGTTSIVEEGDQGYTGDPSQWALPEFNGGSGTTTGGGKSTFDVGAIGTGIGSVLTGIANLFTAGRSTPNTNPYGPGTDAYGRPAQQSSISPALIGAGILGLGVLLVMRKKT